MISVQQERISPDASLINKVLQNWSSGYNFAIFILVEFFMLVVLKHELPVTF